MYQLLIATTLNIFLASNLVIAQDLGHPQNEAGGAQLEMPPSFDLDLDVYVYDPPYSHRGIDVRTPDSCHDVYEAFSRTVYGGLEGRGHVSLGGGRFGCRAEDGLVSLDAQAFIYAKDQQGNEFLKHHMADVHRRSFYGQKLKFKKPITTGYIFSIYLTMDNMIGQTSLPNTSHFMMNDSKPRNLVSEFDSALSADCNRKSEFIKYLKKYFPGEERYIHSFVDMVESRGNIIHLMVTPIYQLEGENSLVSRWVNPESVRQFRCAGTGKCFE